MLKLLTNEGREKVSEEYKVRRIIVIILALIVIVVITIIGLLPSYILSNGREQEAAERLRLVAEADDQKEGQKLRIWLSETNKKLGILTPSLDTDKPSDSIESVVKLQSPGIKLTGFSWTKVRDKVTISLTGTASDRQALVRFETSIEKSGLFSDVTLPISDLAKDRNIGFQIKFSPL